MVNLGNYREGVDRKTEDTQAWRMDRIEILPGSRHGVKDSGDPLPLPYHINSNNEKYSESIEKVVDDGIDEKNSNNNNKTKNNNELKIMRKALAIIGSPLPLTYIQEEGNAKLDEANNISTESNVSSNSIKKTNDESNSKLTKTEVACEDKVEDESKSKRPKNNLHNILRLSDLGDPLPLKYNNRRNIELEETVIKQRKTSSNPRILNTLYDFGSPLPLHYKEGRDVDSIETDEYLEWKNSKSKHSFNDWKNSINVPPHLEKSNQSQNDMSQKSVSEDRKSDISDINASSSLDLKDQLKNDEAAQSTPTDCKVETLTPLPNPTYKNDLELNSKSDSEFTIMNEELHQYLQTKDYQALQDRIDNDAEFKLKLIRYTRQLKREYDLLYKLLHAMPIDIEVDEETKPIQPATDTTPNYLRPILVSVLVFVLLCTLSYLLAD